jgi:hypothetical protein
MPIAIGLMNDMGSYPFLSKRFDRFEVYAETAIGSDSDVEQELREYNEWMAYAEKYLDRYGPIVKDILDNTALPFDLIAYSDDLKKADERDKEWKDGPCRFRMVMRNISIGPPEMERVDVIVAVSQIPEKEHIEALKEQLLKAARSLC